MVSKASDVQATDANPQLQHWWGPVRDEPVNTGTATAYLAQMTSNSTGLTPRYHACDIVPVALKHTDAVTDKGVYVAPPSWLEDLCSVTTFSHFLGNSDYRVIFIQGAMGIRALTHHQGGMTIEPANEKVRELLGFESAAELELSTGSKWGIHFVNKGKQLICVIPSLGSMLAGPACGGGDACVVVATANANVVRGLLGRPPIPYSESPLLACTRGRCTTGQMQRLAAHVVDRQTVEGFKTPSQNGG